MGSVQHFQGSASQQALRLRPCPPKLKTFLDLANLIPPKSRVLPDYFALGSAQIHSKALADKPTIETLNEVTAKFLRQQLPHKKFPRLYKYLGPIRSDRLVEVNDRYRYLCGARLLLSAIANSQRQVRIEVPLEAAPVIAPPLTIDDDKKIRMHQEPLLEALQGVEADRVRQCSECGRIFWAGRRDKFACTKKCVQRRRSRRWRERYPERYKLERVRKADAAESTGHSTAQLKERSGSPNRRRRPH